MIKRKTIKKYFFTVEGETEKWYLEWLRDRINECEEATYKVSFDIQVQKNPLKRAKSLAVTSKTEIWHLSDYESDEPIHVKQFTEVMDKMKAASNLGKQLSYKFGYTNLTFDLWVILHKAACNGAQAHRKNYINSLNQVYGEKFENMDEYKHEDNFKRCLGQLSLDNVRNAIDRANKIMVRNQENGYRLYEYKGYKYYKENPSLTINVIIEKILKDCELM
ncbi:MAG: RloB domain-containing protein [Lachnospiraceae bacterium]